MRGILFDGSRPNVCDDLPMPVPKKDEVLVKILLAGICSTDLEILGGYMGFNGIPGHEFTGRVVQGPDKWVDRRVVAEINFPCRGCDYCRGGMSNHCPNRNVMGIDGRDGAFAEYMAVPVSVLHGVDDSLSDETAVFTEPLAAAVQILHQVQIDASDRVAVLGDGRLGLLSAMVIKTVTPNIVIVGKHSSKLKEAAGKQIRTILYDELAEEKSMDIVVDATGCPSGFETAMRLVRPRGTIVLKSTFAADAGINLAPLVINEVTVTGSRCGPLDEALSMMTDRLIDPRGLITARYPLSDGIEALNAAGDGRNIKVLIEP